MRSSRSFAPLWLAGLLGVGLSGPGHAEMVTFDLGTPAVTPSQARIPVSLTFNGGAGDTIQAIQLSVIGSSGVLTNNGADYSRFTFAVNPATLPNWDFSGFGPAGFGLLSPIPGSGDNLLPGGGAVNLGTLLVNLNGIPAGRTLNVTLAGGPPGLGTDVGGTIGGSPVDSFAALGLVFAQASGRTFVTVPEPGSLILLGLGALGLIAGRHGRRRRLAAGAA